MNILKRIKGHLPKQVLESLRRSYEGSDKNLTSIEFLNLLKNNTLTKDIKKYLPKQVWGSLEIIERGSDERSYKNLTSLKLINLLKNNTLIKDIKKYLPKQVFNSYIQTRSCLYSITPKVKISLTGIILLTTVTACSSYQETFDCPSGTGVGCKPLSTVDQMVERGQLPRKVDDREEEGIPAAQPSHSEIQIPEPEIRLVGDSMSSPGPVVRVPEQTMRVWIRGYADTIGNYHEHSIVYTVVRPASWHTVAHPTKDIVAPIPLKGANTHEL